MALREKEQQDRRYELLRPLARNYMVNRNGSEGI